MQYLSIMDCEHARKEVLLIGNDVQVGNFNDIDKLLRDAGFDPRNCYSMLTDTLVREKVSEKVVHAEKNKDGDKLRPVCAPNDGYSYYI